MNRITPLLAAVIAVFLFACGSEADGLEKHFKKSDEVANTVAVLTGIAVNPLLVSSAIGAYVYYSTPPEGRGPLPWYYSPWFWIACAACVLLAFLLDIPSLLANFPPFIASLAELFNKKIGLIVTSPIVLDRILALSEALAGNADEGDAAGVAYAAASIIPAEWFSFAPQTLWFAAIAPMMLFVFFAMWLLNYVFDMLMLLSPFGWLDWCLKLVRGVFFLLLLAAALFFPQMVFVLVLPVTAVSVALFGWSVRRAVMGVVFLKDILAGQREVPVDGKGVVAFLGPYAGAPSKSIGRLTEENGVFVFSYKRFFLFSRSVTVNRLEPVMKTGLFYSKICDGKKVICLLPPRYKKVQEQVLVRLNIPRSEHGSLKKGMKWLENRFMPDTAADSGKNMVVG